jgi:hypothetical protein
MAFEDIKLPNFVIADLYKHTLIEGEKIALQTEIKQPEKLSPAIETQQHIKFLGDNKKGVVVILKEENAVHLNDDKLLLLTNLLSACKLTLADVAIININKQQVSYKQIKQDLNPQYLLLMGNVIKPIALPFIFPEYRVQQYDNTEMIIAADLDNLLGQSDAVKNEKRKLWESLKLLFKL